MRCRCHGPAAPAKVDPALAALKIDAARLLGRDKEAKAAQEARAQSDSSGGGHSGDDELPVMTQR